MKESTTRITETRNKKHNVVIEKNGTFIENHFPDIVPCTYMEIILYPSSFLFHNNYTFSWKFNWYCISCDLPLPIHYNILFIADRQQVGSL